jgi:hypothetical protein
MGVALEARVFEEKHAGVIAHHCVAGEVGHTCCVDLELRKIR